MPILQFGSKGKTLRFELPRTHGFKITVGRDDENDLSFPDQEMASHHAVLTRSSTGFFILLPRGLAEIRVNGYPVLGLKVLRDNDNIELGTTALQYIENPESVLVYDKSDLLGVECVFCHAVLESGEKAVLCPKCDTAYHESCWGLLNNEPCAMPHCDYVVEQARSD
jgi:hypothetical protein